MPYGLTKARSMGPVAALVERCGGSVARVFRRAELPMRLIEEPDRLILLKDQLKLVECAAGEIGDEALAARLSTEAGIASLGAYGRRVIALPRLDAALAAAGEAIGTLLQSSTRLELRRAGRFVQWTYRVTDPVQVGRQKNEMLALGYMLDLLRRFAGDRWTPSRLELGGAPAASRPAVESVFRCEVCPGPTAAVVFPADILDLSNPRAPQRPQPGAAEIPQPDDLVACVEHLIGLALLEGRPRIDRIGRRLGISRRTLQRHLESHGTSFNALLRRAAVARASALLRAGSSATDVALELGYADPAHFSRAFRGWTGRPPRHWQRSSWPAAPSEG